MKVIVELLDLRKDEMGLGKTVELLACIFTHQVASSPLAILLVNFCVMRVRRIV
ncbi:hypothetical protein KY285_036664 [Solanum tuberosum]|nr:hypothetical protein KY285_036664 [Solanum tuberosum]